tara:strand:+ start:945 stop:1175 length:231 start_codon:yes stop_codon:yes gene_type:complete
MNRELTPEEEAQVDRLTAQSVDLVGPRVAAFLADWGDGVPPSETKQFKRAVLQLASDCFGTGMMMLFEVLEARDTL